MIRSREHINRWFRGVAEYIVAAHWRIIAGVMLVNVIAIMGIPRIEFDSSTDNWFLADDPLVVARDQFDEVFGNNDYVGVLVEADDVFAPDILHMIRKLGAELEAHAPYADQIVSLTDMEFTRGTADGVEIGNIVPEEIPTDPQRIEQIRVLAFSKPFLVNRMFSDDSTQAWIVLRLTSYPNKIDGEPEPRLQVAKTILDILAQETYAAYNLTPSGGPIIEYQKQEFFTREAARLVVLSFAVAVLVLFLCLQTVRGVLIPMASFFSSIVWVFGAMGWLGISVDSTVMTLPEYLGMAVSIGYSIHVFNFFNRTFSTGGNRREAVLHAIEETGWPMLFTAATTLVALLSFYFVNITTVRWMGLSSAAVIVTTYLLVMMLTPALLSFGKTGARYADGSRTDLALRRSERVDRWVERYFSDLGTWVLAHSRLIVIVSLGIALVLAGGLTRLTVSSDFVKTLGLKVPYINQLNYVSHTKIGAFNSYNLTLTFDEADRVKDPDVLKRFEVLIEEVKVFSLTKRGSSLIDIIKDMNQVMHANDPAFYRIPDEQELVAQLLLLYEISDGTEQQHWVDYEYTTLRLMVELNDYDASEVVRNFRHIQQRAATLFPDAQLGMVGDVVQFAVIQEYVAKGEIVSFGISLVVIAVLMMLVFRSVKTGLIGMIPNLAPVLVVGGLMGYFDIPFDMVLMVVIPILLGIAVDDTIHFIAHSQLAFQRSGQYRLSVQRTFAAVGKALFMTTFILVVSFTMFMTSIAAFFLHLGALMTAGFVSALLADYCLTPVLIVWLRPFGRPEAEERTLSVKEELSMNKA